MFIHEVFTSQLFLTIVGFLILLKIYLKATTRIYKGIDRIDGKTVVITGANAGIGQATAYDLARRGARIVMVCRDIVKGEKVKKQIIEETGNSNIVLKYIDFASLATVRACVAEIISEESRIDILLNNAGAVGLGVQCLTEDGLEVHMQVNHFGPFLFTNLLLDKIKKSSPSRIVNVSSSFHKMGKLDTSHINSPDTSIEMLIYCNTKLANNLFTVELAQKLKGTGVTVNCLHPGVVQTEIARNGNGLTRICWSILGTLFFKNPFEGAQTSIYLCVAQDVSDVTGSYFKDCTLAEMSKDAKDKGMAKKLWEISEDAVKLQLHERSFRHNH